MDTNRACELLRSAEYILTTNPGEISTRLEAAKADIFELQELSLVKKDDPSHTSVLNTRIAALQERFQANKTTPLTGEVGRQVAVDVVDLASDVYAADKDES